MSQYVVIGTSPTHDVSVVVGPYRSREKASSAFDEMTYKGYVAETCELLSLDDVDISEAWDTND